jgi:pimeloyl-ACP methyl ester carboxylesterase
VSADAAVPVILVHGTMDRATSFERTRRALEQRSGTSVTTYDRRGYASAADQAPVSDPSSHVADLLEVVAGRPAVVIGHSYGGVIALHAAVEAPALILAVGVYEPPLPFEPWWPPVPDLGSAEVAAERFLRRMVGADAWDRLDESFRSRRRAEGSALLADFAAATVAVDWPGVLTPVHAAHGTASPPHFIRSAATIAELVADATVTAIHGASHGAHLSHPDRFAEWMHTVWCSARHGSA